tara:strand:+ start:45 stop:785 length:741 start_codon:yes stop_codon:yes gene_type:complete
MNKKINYYELLQVTHKFEKSELKKNYRTLSKLHHPDKNGGDSDYFKLLAESYKILTSTDLKDKYDKESKFGSNYDSSLELLDFDFNTDTSGAKMQKKMQNYKKNEMLHIVLEISEFTDTLNYDRNIICSKCEGSTNVSATSLNLNGKMGSLFTDEEIPCDICEGTGSFRSRECPGCGGNGYIKLGLSKCDKCSGDGVLSVNKTVNIKEKDFINGKLKIQFYGNQSKYSGSTGNLYIIIPPLDSDSD